MPSSSRNLRFLSIFVATSCLASAFTAGNSRAAFRRRSAQASSTSLQMSVGAATPDDFDEGRSRRRSGGGESSSGGGSDRPRRSSSQAAQSPPPPPPVAYEGVEYDFQDVHSLSTHSEERLSRIESEEAALARFAHGDELMELRKNVEELRLDLVDARSRGDLAKMNDIKERITEAGRMDAEFIYHLATQRMEVAEREGMVEEAERYHEEAMAARSVLPQFNLEGLWVGKYGPHGYEMINVTYVGDTLIATKVTGDKNVPKGELTFSADLSPEANEKAGLEPIELTPSAAEQWGTKHLPRFTGKGQVAAEGFQNNQWVDGQLIMVGEYFSFAWVPMGHQIFFGRPSAELTLKMLKESRRRELSAGLLSAEVGGDDNALAEMRERVVRCWEETEMLEEDMEVESSSSNGASRAHFYDEEGAFE